MKYLFWDIDGTLLLTGRAGIDALREAIRTRFHNNDFDFSHGLAGCTDSYIIKQAITDLKGRCTAADAAGLLILYNQLLPAALLTHQGKLMPNVQTTLAYLQQTQTNYTSALLTGNCSTAAHLKLKHYGLEPYFDYRLSTFGELSEERTLLAQAALQKLYVQNTAINPQTLTIIGDTPHDIKCAQAIGARCLIILAGSGYSEAELQEQRPWKIIKELPSDPQAFVALLDE
ncbi:MAG: HAD hydrolase-like protein [Acidaminococcaceae bacterium]